MELRCVKQPDVLASITHDRNIVMPMNQPTDYVEVSSESRRLRAADEVISFVFAALTDEKIGVGNIFEEDKVAGTFVFWLVVGHPLDYLLDGRRHVCPP